MPHLSFPQLLSRFRTAHAAHPGRFRAVFLGLLAIVLVVTSLQYAAKVAKPAETGPQSRSAFLRWRAMIRDVFAGENIYVGKNEYPNPPIMAVLLRPFAELPPVVGRDGVVLREGLLAVLAAVWVFRLVKREPRTPIPERERGRQRAEGADSIAPLPVGGGRGGVFIPSRVCRPRKAAAILWPAAALGDLSHNNVNIFILFLVAGCLEAFPPPPRHARGLIARAGDRVQGDAAPLRRVLRVEAGWRLLGRVRSPGWCCGSRSCPAPCSAGTQPRTHDRLVRAHGRAARF